MSQCNLLHFILCLIYYILEEENIEDRSQDVACFCTVWIKLGFAPHSSITICCKSSFSLSWHWCCYLQQSGLCPEFLALRRKKIPQEGKKLRLSLGRARRLRYQWCSQEAGWSLPGCALPLFTVNTLPFFVATSIYAIWANMMGTRATEDKAEG